MENLPRSGLAAPGEVCFSFLERGGEFESSRLLKTAKTAVFASLVRYFYFTSPNSSSSSRLFLFLSKSRSLRASFLSMQLAIRVQNRFFIQTIVNASALAKATLRRSLRIITTPNHPDFWCPKQPLPIHATCPEGLFCPEDRAYSQRPG